MHFPIEVQRRARSLGAVALMAMLLIQGVLATAPQAAGVVVEDIDGEGLPLVLELAGPGSATFEVTLPDDGRVTTADLTLNGEGVDASWELEAGPGEWMNTSAPDDEGITVSDDALEVLSEHRSVSLAGAAMLEDAELEMLSPGEAITMALASPDFNGSGGGFWRYYKEVEVTHDGGIALSNAMTYLVIDLPPGHCKDPKEVRLAGPQFREVPWQLFELERDSRDGSVVRLEMGFAADIPASGHVTYRVYYGNPSATEPGYDPLLLGFEDWDYPDVTDPTFRNTWKNVAFTGNTSHGSSSFSILHTTDGSAFHQEVQVKPTRTYSQAWTNTKLDLDDFTLQTWISQASLGGALGSLGMWGIDFRVSGTDCYRLVYVDYARSNFNSHFALYRVTHTRHLESTGTVTRYWTELGSRDVDLNLSSPIPVFLTARGSSLRVYLDDMTSPMITATDTKLSSGNLGTFMAGNSGLMSPVETEVKGNYNVAFLWSPDVLLTTHAPTYVVGGERQHHADKGHYVSKLVELDGARDLTLSLDLVLAEGTSYRADLLGMDDAVAVTDLRDGDPVPEGAVDGGFRLSLTLFNDLDHLTPELRGWGLGYTADVHHGSGRMAAAVENVAFQGATLTLAPSRDRWYKQVDPLLKPGNIPADALHVKVGCLVEYGDGVRLYYTGTSGSGVTSICMATSTNGESYHDHQVVLAGDASSTGWSMLKSSPNVMHVGAMWYMFFIGRSTVGSVGLAISNDGVHWQMHPSPVMTRSASGMWDGHSIEDCFAWYGEGDGLFHMYYTARASSTSHVTSVGYATSSDGAAWSKHARNPVLTPGTGSAWDSGYVRQPYAVLGDDQLVLYYLGGRGNSPSTDPHSVGYAVTQNMVDLKKSLANPVMVPKEGGSADDINGITSVIVLEEEMEPHYMLYSGRGYDRAERAFMARSGYVKDGHYTTAPFELLRAPKAYTQLEVEVENKPATGVEFSVRTSRDEGATWIDWTPLEPDGSAQGILPGSLVQLRANLSAEFGDETPLLHRWSLAWACNVRHGSYTHFPAWEMDESPVYFASELHGRDTEHILLQATADGVNWVDESGTGGYTHLNTTENAFGYRLLVDATPGEWIHLTSIWFFIGYTSFPSNVTLTIPQGQGQVTGQEPLELWSHPGRLEGQVMANVTDELQAYLESLGGQGLGRNGTAPGSLTIPMNLSSPTAGVLTLTTLLIVMDTPPVITSATPTEGNLYIDEGTRLDLEVTVEERDGDELEYWWFIDDVNVEDATGPTYSFKPSEGETWDRTVEVKVEVWDGWYTVPRTWSVRVNETTAPANEPPVISSPMPAAVQVDINENTTASFSVSVSDPDEGPQPLELRWYVNDTLETSGQGTSYDFVADFDSAGTYTIRVEAFDGKAGANRTWELAVANVARPHTPGDGDGEDGEDGAPWMLIAVVIIIVAAAGAGGAMYMRGRTPSAPAPSGAELSPAEGAPPTGGEGYGLEGAGPDTTVDEMDDLVVEKVDRGAEAAVATPAAAAAAAAMPPLVGLPLAKDGERTFVVEEVYVVYNDGRLVHHQSREGDSSVDTDLFGGMFTAIQQFIQDSMGGGRADSSQVGRLDYGENRILVERGNYLFLAAIIFGEEQEDLREAMRETLNRIEGAYAGVIERWSGDQTQLAGVADFVAPLIGLTAGLTRGDVTSRTTKVGVKMLSEVEFFQGFVRLKVAVKNDTRTVITNVATDVVFDQDVLRLARVQPDYDMTGTKVRLGTIGPREKKTVAYYLDPLICQESDIDGTTQYKDAEGAFKTVQMKRRRADIVCPIFFTEENANTAMLKRLIKEELKAADSKLFTIPKMLSPTDAFKLCKEVIRSHDVRFVREFVEGEKEDHLHGEAWFYGVTKVKKDKMVVRASVIQERNTVEFYVASGRMETITGLLAELGQNLNKALKEKYLGRVSATLVVDQEEQDQVKSLGLLIDKYSEGEVEAGEVDQV